MYFTVPTPTPNGMQRGVVFVKNFVVWVVVVKNFVVCKRQDFFVLNVVVKKLRLLIVVIIAKSFVVLIVVKNFAIVEGNKTSSLLKETKLRRLSRRRQKLSCPNCVSI